MPLEEEKKGTEPKKAKSTPPADTEEVKKLKIELSNMGFLTEYIDAACAKAKTF